MDSSDWLLDVVHLNMCFHVGNESVRVTTLITNMQTIFCVIIGADEFVQMLANVFNTCMKTPLLWEGSKPIQTFYNYLKLLLIFINLYASGAYELSMRLYSGKHIDKHSTVFSSQIQAHV